MPTNLIETLKVPTRRTAIVADSVKVIDEEVADKGGFSGLAIKTAYKLVKSFKPGFIPETVDGLLDDFAKQLQPLLDEAGAKNEPVGGFLTREKGRAAEALLAITDARAQRSNLAGIKVAYERLRPTAKKHVEEAMPRVGAMIEKNLA